MNVSMRERKTQRRPSRALDYAAIGRIKCTLGCFEHALAVDAAWNGAKDGLNNVEISSLNSRKKWSETVFVVGDC
jgi:hypothetical protein